MPRMIELIKQSAVPANVMRTAAKGALPLPAPEMIEVLVYLTSSPLFGQEARFTLAAWDETACVAVCSDPASPREVLDYFAAPQNRRPRLVPAMLENPSVPESVLLDMAQEQSRETLQLLLGSARVKTSAKVLHAMAGNPLLTPPQLEQVMTSLQAFGAAAPEAAPDEADTQVAQFVAEHAAEIAAEEGTAFQLVGEGEAAAEVAAPAAEAAPAAASPATAAAAAAPAPAQAAEEQAAEEKERISPLQKISRLTVGQRVQLAMKGNKEERYILIRDGSKVVSSAVLESPKLTDQEIEMFASLKNVQESVLRGIAGKRKFMKTYGVVRALANNPRCPLDVQLTILKNLLNQDLRTVSMNKNVSETVRKVALKMFKERTEKKTGAG